MAKLNYASMQLSKISDPELTKRNCSHSRNCRVWRVPLLLILVMHSSWSAVGIGFTTNGVEVEVVWERTFWHPTVRATATAESKILASIISSCTAASPTYSNKPCPLWFSCSWCQQTIMHAYCGYSKASTRSFRESFYPFVYIHITGQCIRIWWNFPGTSGLLLVNTHEQ